MARLARFVSLALAAVSLSALPLGAQGGNARFDLTGPAVDVRVTRQGTSLPIAMVPNLLAGDQLWLHPDLPSTQSVKYLLVVAFLRGTTNPPPENWVTRIETWDKHVRAEGTRITVPDGAEQALLLLAPETGGDISTLRSAIRARPGVFVRASQDLDEAGFEQARIEKYLEEIRRVPPGDSKALAEHSDFLARTLSLRPNTDCFKRPVEQQYACLTQSGSQSLLDDGHGQSIVNSLTSGASSDLINSASATSLAGGGVYSAYVGAVVDVVRIMSGLHTAHYQYIPAIAFPQNQALNLRLNTPPSFENPKSVIVIGLPAIRTAAPPRLRASDPHDVTCLLKPHAALAVEGSPLVFSTDFTHDLTLRQNAAASQPALPLTPDAFQGGLVIGEPAQAGRSELDSKGNKVTAIAPAPPPARDPGQANPTPDKKSGGPSAEGATAADDPAPPPQPTATVEGFWGFDHFAGPTLPVQSRPGTDWKLRTAGEHLILGEKNQLTLSSSGTACIDSITLQEGTSPEQKLEWKSADTPNIVHFDVTLHGTNAGAVRILVHQFGEPEPEALSMQAFSKPAAVESIDLHAGDRSLTLNGSGLSEVKSIELGGATFTPTQVDLPEASSPAHSAEFTLPLTTKELNSKSKAGDHLTASLHLADGRVLSLPVTIERARPSLTVLNRSVQAADAGSKIQLSNPEDIPLNATLMLSLHMATPFPRDAQVEVASPDSSLHTRLSIAEGTLVLQDKSTVVTQIDLQKAFGPSAFGPLQIRAVLHDGTVGDWQPLATIVRLPELTSLTCATAADATCTLSGNRLFLLSAVATDASFTKSVEVPDGFVSSTLSVGKPAPSNTLYLKLRDDPTTTATVVLAPTIGAR